MRRCRGGRLGERIVAGGPAIDRHQQRRAAAGERADGLDIRAIAFENPVGNVDERRQPAMAQESARASRRRWRHRRRSRRKSRPFRRARPRPRGAPPRPACRPARSGPASARARSDRGSFCVVSLDATAGEHARQQLRQFVRCAIASAQRRAALVKPVAPDAPGRRALDAQEDLVHVGNIWALGPRASSRQPPSLEMTQRGVERCERDRALANWHDLRKRFSSFAAGVFLVVFGVVLPVALARRLF